MQPNRVVALASPNRVAAWAHPLGAALTDRLIPLCSRSGIKGALATWAPRPNPSQDSEHQGFTEVPHGFCTRAAERAGVALLRDQVQTSPREQTPTLEVSPTHRAWVQSSCSWAVDDNPKNPLSHRDWLREQL